MKTFICPPDQFSAKHILTFLKRDEHDQTISIRGNRVRKALVIHSKATVIDATIDDGLFHLNEISNPDISLEEADRFIRHWFDLDYDLNPFYKHLKTIPYGEHLLKQCGGFRIIRIPTLFEVLCWTVIGQQINFKFALELKRRFITSFGQKLDDLYVFPTIQELESLNFEDLLDLKFGKFKSKYILNIIDFMNQNDEDQLVQLSKEELFKTLLSIKGIGEWSVQYAMMKYFHFYDIFPIKDVGLHNAIAKLHGFDQKPTMEQLDSLLEKYGKYRGYIAQYLYLTLQY